MGAISANSHIKAPMPAINNIMARSFRPSRTADPLGELGALLGARTALGELSWLIALRSVCGDGDSAVLVRLAPEPTAAASSFHMQSRGVKFATLAEGRGLNA